MTPDQPESSAYVVQGDNPFLTLEPLCHPVELNHPVRLSGCRETTAIVDAKWA